MEWVVFNPPKKKHINVHTAPLLHPLVYLKRGEGVHGHTRNCFGLTWIRFSRNKRGWRSLFQILFKSSWARGSLRWDQWQIYAGAITLCSWILQGDFYDGALVAVETALSSCRRYKHWSLKKILIRKQTLLKICAGILSDGSMQISVWIKRGVQETLTGNGPWTV